VTSLKYAHVERERRWLLAGVPALPADARQVRIMDRYLHGTRLRLREVTGSDGTVIRKLGHKVRIGNGAAAVAHTSLYLDEAEWDLLGSLPADVLRKTRTLVVHHGGQVAVDVFEGGLVLAEIDLGDGPWRDLPATYDVVREVSQDERFTGAALASLGR
jgi:CYTH domain-containing protein